MIRASGVWRAATADEPGGLGAPPLRQPDYLPAMPSVPERLAESLADRYRIERTPDGEPVLLGRGGTALVYLALDVRHDRQVALKVVHPELAASVEAERFLREIRLVARLSHPHILPLFDSGQAGDPRDGP